MVTTASDCTDPLVVTDILPGRVALIERDDAMDLDTFEIDARAVGATWPTLVVDDPRVELTVPAAGTARFVKVADMPRGDFRADYGRMPRWEPLAADSDNLQITFAGSFTLVRAGNLNDGLTFRFFVKGRGGRANPISFTAVVKVTRVVTLGQSCLWSINGWDPSTEPGALLGNATTWP